MKFYGEKADDILVRFLGEIEPQYSMWRALVFDGAAIGLEAYSEEMLKTLSCLLNRYEHDDTVRVFVCDDGRIVLLYTNLLSSKIMPMWQSMLAAIMQTEELQELLGQYNGIAPKSTQDIFDLSVGWNDFQRLFLAKPNSPQPELHPKNQVNSRVLAVEERLAQLYQEAATELFQQKLQQRTTRDLKEILLIEDDPLSVRMIQNTLKNKHDIIPSAYNITGSKNGIDGLDGYLRYPADIVFLDIDMPRLSGHATLQHLLKIDPDAFVVMLSGNMFKEDILKAMQAGAKGFVGKPFTPQKLFTYLQKCPTLQRQIAVA